MTEPKTVLIHGGPGIEKEISLLTSQKVEKALTQLNIPHKTLTADSQLFSTLLKMKPTKAFIAGHGPYAEDGILQSLLEYLKIPYTGSGVLASSICMDKSFFKQWITRQKIPNTSFILLHKKSTETPPAVVTNQNRTPSDLNPSFLISLSYLDPQIKKELPSFFSKNILEIEDLTFPAPFLPCVVKPNRSGSSIGIYICHSQEDFENNLPKSLKIDSQVLIEPYIKGSEIAVSWLAGHGVLTPVEVVPLEGCFYDFKRKYEKNQTQYFIPARCSPQITAKLKDITCRIQQSCHVRSYLRVDFIIDSKENIYVIELNTLPGLTHMSLLPRCAEYDGIGYDQLILKILSHARLDYQ